jgi:hypothetical protein
LKNEAQFLEAQNSLIIKIKLFTQQHPVFSPHC